MKHRLNNGKFETLKTGRMAEFEILCNEVCALAKHTGHYIKQEAQKFRTNDVEVKSIHNFVTYVDKTSEQKLVKALAVLLPEAGFIAEEGTTDKKGDVFNWVIDPLDGTTNFIHGVPCYSISIALMRHEEVVLGVVYEINLDECFYTWEGGKAYMNGKEIGVTQASHLKDSLFATGFPYYDYQHLDGYMDFFKFLMIESRGVRRLGSAAVDLAYVACGRFEGFYEYSLNPWDVAAGAFIVQQAGGRVCDFKGGNNYIFGAEIIAANPYIIDIVLVNLQKHFKKKLKDE